MGGNGGEVKLAGDASASAFLHTLVLNTCKAYPNAFDRLTLLESESAFRKNYPDFLPRFEAARLASADRVEIAANMVAGLQASIVWSDTSGERPLAQALKDDGEVEPLRLLSHQYHGEPGWSPDMLYGGERWSVSDLDGLADRLIAERVATEPTGAALRCLQTGPLSTGKLNLEGRRIAVLGGGAEMAPTRLWLEAGAEVLWLDTVPPPEPWLSEKLAGRLVWPEQSVDLLTQPREIRATLIDFANGQPVDLGLYAYAPGQARELRLTAAMNAIVDSLPAELVASVTMLVSPTTPTALDAIDLDAIRDRVKAMPIAERIAYRLGVFSSGDGYESCGGGHATRSVVAIQGASYQAAQYVGKVLTAEVWAESGQVGAGSPQPLRVSANTAAITRTRSLDHPVFAAAFGGAAALGVQTFAPRLSRRMNGLLAVNDWLQSEQPVPGQIRVHGGIHALPYALEAGLRVAAVIGFVKSPGLLKRLIR